MHVYDEKQNFCGHCGSDLKLLHNQEMVGWVTYIGIFYLAHFLLFFVAQLIRGNSPPGPVVTMLLIGLGYSIEISAVLAVVARYPIFRKTVFTAKRFSEMYMGFVLVVVMLAIMYGGIGKLFETFAGSKHANPMGLVMRFQIVQAVLVAPFLEELFFRGIILPALERYAGFWTGLILSSVLFAFAHGFVLAVFIQGIVGLVLGYVYLKTRNIWYCMLLHGLYNSIIMIVKFAF